MNFYIYQAIQLTVHVKKKGVLKWPDQQLLYKNISKNLDLP